jgi:DNA-binding GntR family transcriptional regulator
MAQHGKSRRGGRSVNDPVVKGKGLPVQEAVNKSAKVVPISRTEAVQDALRQAIMEHHLQPGARLPEDAIGEAFGTSRTIAREALGRLAVEGLIELKPNRGAFVANPSLDDGRDTFVVRRGLERTVVETLARRLQPAETEMLKTFVARERSVSGANEKESIRLAGEFHLLLARLTGNHLLARYVTEVVSRCSLILSMYSRSHSAECGIREHEEIVEALIAGDGPLAMRLMDDHVNQVASRASLEPKPERDIRDLLAPYAARMKGLEP